MNVSCLSFAVIFFKVSFAFYPSPSFTSRILQLKSSPWSAGDDWSQLSKRENDHSLSEENVDALQSAADAMEQPIYNLSDEEQQVMDIVEDIHSAALDSESQMQPIYDSRWEDDAEVGFEDDMAREISLLVRCNESPDNLLIEEGRALPSLTEDERNDISQLILLEDKDFKPTDFFRNAIGAIFDGHATEEGTMDASRIASWMSKSLNEHVSPNEKRVLLTLTGFSEYGSGHLTKDDFQRLYLEAIKSALDDSRRKKNGEPTVESIWRDIRNHDILSPIETEHAFKMLEIQKKIGDIKTEASYLSNDVMDECEILEHGDTYATTTSQTPEYKVKEETSHELVKMAADGKTPLYLRDGQFIFIDEESCIGCRQCTNVSPTSFLMLDDNRARCYEQRNAVDVGAAVESCPVNCMYRISFDELKELETARDHGDGRTDHRHLGMAQTHIPVHVARMDSNVNRKSSWYHYLKQKCYLSRDCPKKGCYACPNFAAPGDNPYWKLKHKEAEHIRASTFIASGAAGNFCKKAEL
mmetsp:Transcript_21065/g.31966  ORF Transcript_21065/g.31966 Transcript_21065/m.31966 type:complete len:527 (-) Transcript_21065:111-1691(-)